MSSSAQLAPEATPSEPVRGSAWTPATTATGVGGTGVAGTRVGVTTTVATTTTGTSTI